MLTSLKHINYIKHLCLSIKVKIRIAVFALRWCQIRYGDISYMGVYIALFLCTSWYSPLGFGVCVLLSWLTDKVLSYVFYPEKVRDIELCFICMVLVCPVMLIT